jgi:hypothetical protein
MCGAPVGTASGDQPLMQVVPGEIWELCEIACWRGYLKSDFFAHRLGRESGPEIARSPMFRRRGDAPPPQDDRIAAAHEKLVDALLAAGGERTPWYAQRFRRRVGRLPAEPSPPADTGTREERAEDSKEEAAP